MLTLRFDEAWPILGGVRAPRLGWRLANAFACVLASVMLVACGNGADADESASSLELPLIAPDELNTVYAVSAGDFTGWTRPDGALVDPEAARSGVFVDLEAGQRLRTYFRELMVVPGDVVTLSIEAYSPEGDAVSIIISRLCDQQNGDDFTRYDISLGLEPQEYIVSHKFNQQFSCFYIDLYSVDESRFFVRYISVERLIEA